MSIELLRTIPLISLNTYSYTDAKQFSKVLDEQLGFEIERIETSIKESNPSTPWAGLDPQALQTPYPEILLMLNTIGLREGQTVVDLGAAYGRMGLVISSFFSGSNFLGLEVSAPRAKEGNRIYELLKVNSKRVQLRLEDISKTTWELPNADAYFIYDFGDLESILRVIDKMKARASQMSITVVGRGRRTRDQIERHEPWLSLVRPPIHCGNFSIYRS